MFEERGTNCAHQSVDFVLNVYLFKSKRYMSEICEWARFCQKVWYFVLKMIITSKNEGVFGKFENIVRF